MTSTNHIQLSLLMEEAEILEEEANRQMVEAVRTREEAIARGESIGNLKQISASRVAVQIVRAALPEVQKRQIENKRKEKR